MTNGYNTIRSHIFVVPHDEFGDVTIEKVGNTTYQATAETKNGPVSIRVPTYRDKPIDTTVDEWLRRMPSEELDAGKQAYFDIWNFHDGDDFYQWMYLKFDEALKRKRDNSLYISGDLRYVTDGSKLQRFDGSKWNDIDCDAYSLPGDISNYINN